MESRNILDYQGNVIGIMELPEDTPESVWTQRLSMYSQPPEDQTRLIKLANIEERKSYADDLLTRFKEKNIDEGINALQAMWIHHKMRELNVTFYGVPMKLDLLNMAVSGDIEVACLALMNCVTDDMSMPYHWLNSTRVNWIIAEMKSYLGWS